MSEFAPSPVGEWVAGGCFVTRRPRLLDVFSCEGGASEGYRQAGFDVFGIDLFKYKNDKGKTVGFSRKRYPFAAYQSDAIEALLHLVEGGTLPFTHLDGTTERLGLDDFATVHASPPCQHASAGTRSLRQDGAEYPALIPDTRHLLIATGLPYVIENVRGSDLIDPVELCGCMFDLKAVDTDGITLHLQRPRGFESNIALSPPREHDHSEHEWVGGSYGGARRDKYEAKYVRHGGYVPSKKVQQRLLGIDWMTQAGMYQSLPPVSHPLDRDADHEGA